MMNVRNLLLSALAAALAVCASIQPVVRTTTSPEPSGSYIAGTFTRSSSGGFAFIVRNVESGTEYGMPLGEDSLLPKDVTDQVIAIKVPPGRYEVSQWITYGTLTKERSSKREIKNPYLAKPFTVEAGSVTHLGKFSVTTAITSGYTNWSIKPNPMTSQDAKNGFLAAYPSFTSHSFSCRLCTDTLAR